MEFKPKQIGTIYVGEDSVAKYLMQMTAPFFKSPEAREDDNEKAMII